MNDRLYLDIACRQANCYGERICGDNYLCRHIAMGRRTLVVLSDGMGHGVKANILSTLTSTMLLEFISMHRDIAQIADTILRMLPICRIRKISYATFTIADIDNTTGEVSVAQHDNPAALLIRDGHAVPLQWEKREITRKEGRPLSLSTCRFTATKGDRLIMVSDGITQSGQRTGRYKFGWGEPSLEQFLCYLSTMNSGISSADLASQVISKADINDAGRPSDDMSCAAVLFRAPRRLMLVSCPPSLTEENERLITAVRKHEGERVVCGYPVARILSEGLNLPMERDESASNPLQKPVYRIPGFDLITEGLVVPGRVLDLLEHSAGESIGRDVPARLCRHLLRSDEIEMAIGMRRNLDVDATQADEFELRRNVLYRIAKLLETKFGKRVSITRY